MVITLPKPPALNHLYGTNKFGAKYLKPKGEAWKQELAWRVKEAQIRPIEGEVRLLVKLYTCRHQDNDSVLKLLQDSLQAAGVIEDDYWIFDLRVVKEKCKIADERVEIEVAARGITT